MEFVKALLKIGGTGLAACSAVQVQCGGRNDITDHRKCQKMRKTSSRPLDLSDQSCPIRILEQLYVYVREMIERDPGSA